MTSQRFQCSDCHAPMKEDLVEQEFERDGIRVVVGGIPAWKCENCGAVSYPPGIMDHVVRSARELHEAAKAGRSGFAFARAGDAESEG